MIPATKDKISLIDDTLNCLFSKNHPLFPELFEAARYSLFNGGKRLRPLLVLTTAEALEANIEKALIPAAAIEMIHTYSLIHDDLPCMDNDDFRRGCPTLHKAFNEGLAVLAGDFLLTYAFEVLAEAPGISISQKLALISLLAKNSGASGMVGGQVMDISAEGKRISLEELNTIHKYKSGALLIAAVKFGGIIAGANDKEMVLLQKFGEDIGLAYQIVDDIIDVTSSMQKHGKPISSDVINDKTSYVTLMSLQEARKAANDLLESGINHLNALHRNTTSELKDLASKLVLRNF